MSIAVSYHLFKEGLLAQLGMSNAMMHVHAGMAIYLAAQIVFRTRRGSLRALMAVLALETANEVLDWLAKGWDWSDTLGDFALTLMWPVLVATVSLYRRRRWERHVRRHRALRIEMAGGPNPALAG